MPRKKPASEEVQEPVSTEQAPIPTDEQRAKLMTRLQELDHIYAMMLKEGIRSLSDIEVKIANVRLEISKLAN